MWPFVYGTELVFFNDTGKDIKVRNYFFPKDKQASIPMDWYFKNRQPFDRMIKVDGVNFEGFKIGGQLYKLTDRLSDFEFSEPQNMDCKVEESTPQKLSTSVDPQPEPEAIEPKEEVLDIVAQDELKDFKDKERGFIVQPDDGEYDEFEPLGRGRNAAVADIAKKTKGVPIDWSKRKASDLRDELERRGLSSSGYKKSLVKRLEDNDAATLVQNTSSE